MLCWEEVETWCLKRVIHTALAALQKVKALRSHITDKKRKILTTIEMKGHKRGCLWHEGKLGSYKWNPAKLNFTVYGFSSSSRLYLLGFEWLHTRTHTSQNHSDLLWQNKHNPERTEQVRVPLNFYNKHEKIKTYGIHSNIFFFAKLRVIKL